MPTIEAHLPEVPSFFEILTGVVFRWFADVAVDAAVLEVGLGGTWDATNVATGRVAVVTNVSIDHVEYLGPTCLDIAGEKSGIVKPGATLVLGEPDPAVASRSSSVAPTGCCSAATTSGCAPTAWRTAGGRRPRHPRGSIRRPVPLPPRRPPGRQRRLVARTAVEALLDRPLDPERVAQRCAAASTSPAVSRSSATPRSLLLDGAHNVAGAHALREALAEEFPAAARTLVVGLLQPKDPARCSTPSGRRTWSG